MSNSFDYFKNESQELMNSFKLTKWQYLVILAIAISGISGFVSTYNEISNINSNKAVCAASTTLQKELKIQFWILLIISILAIILGIILAVVLRKKQNGLSMVTLSIVTIGILGLVYTLSTKLEKISSILKISISWISFFSFIIIGFLISRRISTEK